MKKGSWGLKRAHKGYVKTKDWKQIKWSMFFFSPVSNTLLLDLCSQRSYKGKRVVHVFALFKLFSFEQQIKTSFEAKGKENHSLSLSLSSTAWLRDLERGRDSEE